MFWIFIGGLLKSFLDLYGWFFVIFVACLFKKKPLVRGILTITIPLAITVAVFIDDGNYAIVTASAGRILQSIVVLIVFWILEKRSSRSNQSS